MSIVQVKLENPFMKKRILSCLLSPRSMVSCSSFKSVSLSKVQFGMTKAETIQALSKKPDNIIGARQYEDGVLEVLQFSRVNSSPVEQDAYDIYWL